MARSDIGQLVYDIVVDTSKFKSGTKVVGAEINQLKKVALDSGTAIDRLSHEFDKLTRLSRDVNKGLKISSIRFGQLAADSKQATQAAREHIASLRKQAAAIRGGTKGRALTDTQRNQVVAFERSADAFEKQLAVQTRLTDARRKGAAWQAAMSEQEVAATKRTAQARADAAAARTAQDRAYLARVKQNSMVQEEARQQASRRQRQQEQAYLASVRQGSMDRQAERQKALTASRSRLSTGRKIIHQMRELRAAEKSGAITAHEHAAARRTLNREFAKFRALRFSPNEPAVPTSWVNQFGAIARQIGIITALYRTWAMLQDSVRQALELERAETQFKIFLGNAGQARRLMGDMRDMAARTPLTFTGVRQGATTLLQYGVSVTDVKDRLRQLGDVSGGNLESLQRLTLAFGQITANGRLQGQELRQLVEAGFNPLMAISESTGESMGALRDRMADGAVSAEEIADALDTATSEGGRFNNMLDKIGKETASGQIQVLRGQLELLRADLASFVSSELGWTAKQISDLLASFRNLGEELNRQTNNMSSPVSRYLQMVKAIALRAPVFTGALHPLVKISDRIAASITAAERVGSFVLGFDPNEGASRSPIESHSDDVENLIQNYRKLSREARHTKEELENLQLQADTELGPDQLFRFLDAREQAKIDQQQSAHAARLLEIKKEIYDIENGKGAYAKKDLTPEQRAELEIQEEKLRVAKERQKAVNDRRDMLKKESEANEKFQRKDRENTEAKAKAHRDELDEMSGIKKELMEIQQLQDLGALSEEEANKRREQIREKFLKDQEAKENKSQQMLIPTARKDSREEYQLIAKLASGKNEEAAREKRHKEQIGKFDEVVGAIEAAGPKIEGV